MIREKLVLLVLACLHGAACRPADSERAEPTATAPALAAETPTKAPEPEPDAKSEAAGPATGSPELKAYPGSTRFCDGRVYPQGTGAHISWESYWSSDARDVVVEHYTRSLGTDALEQAEDDATWRFPPDRPTRTLSVEPPTASAPWSVDCTVPENARSIVTITHFPR